MYMYIYIYIYIYIYLYISNFILHAGVYFLRAVLCFGPDRQFLGLAIGSSGAEMFPLSIRSLSVSGQTKKSWRVLPIAAHALRETEISRQLSI
jgi:hypothetical protein